MCEFSGKLIAWLDRELPAEEAAEVERHLQACPECRGCLDAYERVSCEFAAYCDDAMASSESHKVRGWVAAPIAAGAATALVALFLLLPRTRVEQPSLHTQQIANAASPALVAKVEPALASPVHRVHRRQGAPAAAIQNAKAMPAQSQAAFVPPDEGIIQIAIPADEMFPPGAVPEGMNFVADVTIAADGSAERLRLRPRLAGFEGGTTQP